MNRVYPEFVDTVLTLALMGMGGTMKAQLVADTGGYDQAHDVIGDLSAHLVGTAQTLAGISTAIDDDGYVELKTTTTSLSFSGITAGTDIGGMVIWLDTASVDPVVIWVDSQGDGTGFGFEANGSTITVPVPSVLARF